MSTWNARIWGGAGLVAGLLLVAACSGRDDAVGGDGTSRVPLQGSPTSFRAVPGDDPALAEVRALARADRFEPALDLVRTYRLRHPEDDEAERLELAIEVAEKEHHMRGLVEDQAAADDPVVGDPDYLEARAAARRAVRARLAQVEFLIERQRYPEAVSMCNAILTDHPYNRATNRLKSNLLQYMIDSENDRLRRERAIANGEALNDVWEKGTFPPDPKPIPRTVIVFDEDIEDAERNRVLDKLRLEIPSINYKQAPVGEVLKELFAIAGINYVLLDEAIGQETFTLRLVDVTLEKLLDTMQRSVDIRFNYHGNMVYVTSADSEVLITEIIRLKSGFTDTQRQAQMQDVGAGGAGGGSGTDLFGAEGPENTDLARLLERIPDLVEWPAGSQYYIEPKSNTLYLRSSPSTVAEVKRLVHAMDYNSTMVLIEARFVEVSASASMAVGVDWKIGGFKTSGSTGTIAGGVQSGGSTIDLTPLGPLSNPALSNAASAAVENALSASTQGLSLGVIGAGANMNPNFEARINALEEKGLANTLSEPKILTISNATGIIDISRDVVYVSDFENRSVSSDATSTGGNVINTTRQVVVPQFERDFEGIVLNVRPSVARNKREVTMQIAPTVREFIRFEEEEFQNPDTPDITNQIREPVFSTRRLATTLHVLDGQTVVLGGLVSEKSQKNRGGIPFLSRIPLAGALFRTDRKQDERSKLLIFVTAQIIDPSGAAFTKDVRYMRDIARVVLPASVSEELERARIEEMEEAEARRLEHRRRASELPVNEPEPEPGPEAEGGADEGTGAGADDGGGTARGE